MYNTKNKTQKAYAKNKPNLNLVPKNCVCVFPIELVGGKTQVSNLGIMPNRRSYDKGSFLYWQEVFDGRSALKIQWEDSIKLEKPDDQNYYLAKPSIGKYYYGKPISSGSESLEISEDASYEDFMSMKASQTITIRFEYDPVNRNEAKWELEEQFRFKLVDNDIYNLYLIPEVCEEKLMYISDHQEYFDDLTGLSKGCEITFASLGDKIQKSGRAIEQYCSWNAPGEFAVRPEIVEYYDEETEAWEKEVIINPVAYYFPVPVKYLQVEQQGPALTSTIYALGRRQEWDDTEQCWKIGPSKFLLPCEFITTQPNPLNRISTPSKNFFCFPNEEVTMVTTANCLKWLQEQATQPLEQVKNGGMISIGDNWQKNGSEQITDNKSNPLGTSGIRKDYFDKSWQPLSYEGAYLGPHDTSGCIYATSSMSFNSDDTMIDIMCKNAFIYNQQPIIPLSFYSSRPLFLRDIPLVGTIANFFKLGDIKLTNRTTSRKCSSLCLFGDADISFMCAELNGAMGDRAFKQGSAAFPINFFGTNEEKFQKLGVNATNTTFCVALTDKIQLSNSEEPWDTIYLGQSQYEDGTYIFPETHQSLLVDSSLKPIKPTTSNFIIDAVVVQSIFDGKIRLSCYGEEEQDFIYPQWTATILSNANWENGNMRDWTNIFLLSNWEERFCVQETEFTWPEPPHKKDDSDYVLDTSVLNDFNYKWNKALSPSDYNVWTSANFPWSTISIKEVGPRSLVGRTELNKLIYTQTVSYSDLGCEDKAQFFQDYASFDFSFDKSKLQIYDVWSSTVLGSKFSISVESGTDHYELSHELATARHSGQWELKFSGSGHEFHLGGKRNMPTLERAVKGSFVQRFKIEFDLRETDIAVKLYNTSYAYITGGITISGYNGLQPINVYSRSDKGYVEPEQLRSLIELDKIIFKKNI